MRPNNLIDPGEITMTNATMALTELAEKLRLPAVITADLRLNEAALRDAAQHHEGQEEAA